MEDPTILEVLDLDICVQSQLHLELLSCVRLHLQQLVHLQVLVQVDCVLFLTIQTYLKTFVPKLSAVSPFTNSKGIIPIPAKLLRWILSND